MSNQIPLANTSRKRMKETRPRAKRTPSQLAHLEELVEGKKPGSLNGSFSVFEVAPTVPRRTEAPHPAKHALPRSFTASSPASSASGKRQNADTTSEFIPPRRSSDISIPNISRGSILSFTRVHPLTDFRSNTVAGVLNTGNILVPTTYMQTKTQTSNDSLPLSYSYVTNTPPQYFTSIRPSLPTRSRTDPHSPLASSYTSTISPVTSPAPSLDDTSVSDLSSVVEYPIVDNFWSWSSKFMLTGPRGAELAHLEDCLSEDILVRATVFGWESIGESWELPPFWRIIRQLDENLFRLFPSIERMASFKVIHTLLKFHSDPTPQRATTMPSFYQSSGIDFEGDYYIGNFLPWPGIRSMTKNPLHPCRSNRWFQAQLRTLKLLWPHRFEDSFTRSAETGLYKLTDDFNRRSYDINCWTFGPDMYEEFPVVFGSAPSRGTIPGALGYVGGRGASVEGKTIVRGCIEYPDVQPEEMSNDRTVSVPSRSGSMLQNDIMTIMEANPPNYNNLNWREERKDGKKVVYFTLW